MRGWRGYFGFCKTPDLLIQSYSLGSLAPSGGVVAAVENPARRRAMLIQLGVRAKLAANLSRACGAAFIS